MPIVATRHGKPYVLVQPLEGGAEELVWNGLADQRLRKAWAGEPDGLYDYAAPSPGRLPRRHAPVRPRK